MLLRGLSPLVATLSTPLAAPVIVGIDEVAWTPIHYPHAIWDDDAGCWITDVEVAETGYTAFAGTRHQVAARLVVRRIRREPPPGLDELLPAWGNHALSTDTALSTIDADLTHCAHTLIEQVFADLIDASAGAPAGRFAANGPWLLCAALAHNLTCAVGTLTGHADAHSPRRHPAPPDHQRRRPPRPPRPRHRPAPTRILALEHPLAAAVRRHPRPAPTAPPERKCGAPAIFS